MHPLFWLAAITFAMVAGLLIWNRISTHRQSFGDKAAGVGGPSDPIACATDEPRDPDEMRAGLDEAASQPMGRFWKRNFE